VLLKKSEVVIKTKGKYEPQSQLLKEINSIITQKPNTKLFFFIPKEWIYLINSQPNDTTWLDSGLRKIGEPPVLLDYEGIRKSVLDIQNYLKYEKGYYDAIVDYAIDEKSSINRITTTNGMVVTTPNTAKLKFVIDTKERYTIKSINYESEDENLLKIIEQNMDQSYVNQKKYFLYSEFELEKNRITLDIQNNGYANFTSSYIDIKADSNKITKEIDYWFEVALPVDKSSHTKYSVGDINVYTDYVKANEVDSSYSSSQLGLNLFRNNREFLVRPAVLRQSIFFKSGDTFRRDERQKTFKKLNSLGTYRFVNITSNTNIENDTIIDLDIFLTPYENKWILQGDFETYYSRNEANSLFGLSVSSVLQNRNFLGGSENFSLRGQFGIGFGIGTENNRSVILQQSRNFSLLANLQLPTHLDFLGLSKLVHRMGLVKNQFYRAFDEEAITNISGGINSIKFINFYNFNSFKASYGFDYSAKSGNRYIFRPLSINFDQYDILDSANFLNNPIIFLQFRDVLGTGFFFSDFTYIYNGPISKKGNSILAINKLEVSGLEVHLANKLANLISNRDDEWKINLGASNEGQGIAFAKYVKYDFDFRFNKEFSKKHSFVVRFNSGFAVPYNRDNVVPFIKQFGLGGPNSMRAWNIRQLGPGGYIDPLIKVKLPPTINVFVQQGDVELETNAEYRFKILFILDGAIFVDAGNVWNLQKDPERPNVELSKDFVNQIAVAAGYGLRLNFGFFVVRLDAGYKVRNPYRDRYINRNWYTWREIRDQGLGNVQVAVNYPF